jgi:hypothetical protein
LSDQGSNLDFPESKSGVLPITPSDKNNPGFTPLFGLANVEELPQRRKAAEKPRRNFDQIFKFSEYAPFRAEMIGFYRRHERLQRW